jgi:plasmid stabilization system protein ParE
MSQLRVTYSEPAEAELEAAYSWLCTFGFEVAERWLEGLSAAIKREAELLGAVTLRRQRAPDAPEGRALFVLLYRTGVRRGSPWHIVYELRDEDGDGREDTFCVVRVRHAASGGP